MGEKVLWSIGAADGRSGDLIDNYENPLAVGEAVWRVGESRQRWPLFHPSEADPEGGYRRHPYAIEFVLEGEPRGTYRLRVDYLAIAPRLADLEIEINGIRGVAYLRPAPSRSGEIRLHAGLHTAIYAEGTAEVIVPGALLRRGMNRVTLTAVDGGEVIRVERAQAIKRLDRMANGAGFVYQRVCFSRVDEAPGVVAKVEVRPSVVYRRGADGVLRERCHLYLELGGPVAAGRLRLEVRSGEGVQTVEVAVPATAFGQVRVPFEVVEGEGVVEYGVSGRLGEEVVEDRGEFRRKRKWTVYVAPHVHTDIGYTHRQWEVAERLCRVVDAAVELLEVTGSSFAFHIDSAWILEHYFATRDEGRRRRLVAQIRAGRFGAPGVYVGLLTHLAGLEDLIRNGEFADRLLRGEGLKTDFAAIVDIASLSGALPAVLEGAGVRYLVHANNQDRGPFRVLGGLHRLAPYWWEGVHGGRVLVWLSKMYCELRKVCGSPPVPSAAERGLDLWLDEYEGEAYAPDTVLMYGQEADNTDLDPQPATFLRRWNEAYAYPRLVPSNVSDFFRDVEGRFGDVLPAVRGDGGAYWEDGAGSTMAATARLRHAQATLPRAEALETLSVVHGEGFAYPGEQFEEAWRQVLLADEHTWGAFLSGRDPEALLAHDQWAVKEGMISGAAGWADRLLHVAATRHSLQWNTNGREVVIYNPHSWAVSGAATVEIGRGERLVEPETGAAVPVRRVRTTVSQAVVEVWVEGLPGLGYLRFELRSGEGEGEPAFEDVAPAVVLENRFYRLEVDTRRGVVRSWFDKELGRELVDGRDRWGFGQLVYARGGEGTRLVSNRADLPERDPELFGDFAFAGGRIERWAGGTTLRVEGEVAYGRLAVEWTVREGVRAVEVRYAYEKEERLEKEAVYVAFPLALAGARVESDGQLGWVDWARDELPGGCKEWVPLQTGVLVSGGEAAVLICSPEVPLFCVGEVVRGRWPKELDLTGGRIFSYVLNNYWHTNYKASQGGVLTFSYVLTSDKAIARDRAYRLGWQARRPLYAQRISFQDFRTPREPYLGTGGGTLARIGSERVVLSTLKPARWAEGWIARLQEIGGEGQVAAIAFPGRRFERAWLVNLLEEEIGPLDVEEDGTLRVPVPAWGLATVRFVLTSQDMIPSG